MIHLRPLLGFNAVNLHRYLCWKTGGHQQAADILARARQLGNPQTLGFAPTIVGSKL
jgi:hypothetical protein